MTPILATLLTAGAAEPATVRLVSSAPASSHGDRIARQALRVVMARAGLSYQLSNEPRERALASLKAGLYDADILRLHQFDQAYPGAIRVEPHFLTTTVLAFSRDPDLRPRSWQALQPLTVAHLRGARVIEVALLPGQRRELVPNAEACLSMVALRRVDVCLLNAELGFQPPALPGGEPLQRTVLARVPLYIWVAPSRQDLAQTLGTALKAAVASGELARVAGADRDP